MAWENVLDDLLVTLPQGHGSGIDKHKFAYMQDKIKTTKPITTNPELYQHWSCILPD